MPSIEAYSRVPFGTLLTTLTRASQDHFTRPHPDSSRVITSCIGPDVVPEMHHIAHLTSNWESGSCSCSMPSKLCGLPTELSLEIFDHLLMDQSRLTHRIICTFRHLAQTSKFMRQLVISYFNRHAIRTFVLQALARNKYRESPLGTFKLAETPGSWYQIDLMEEPDLIFEIIRDDCSSCFEWVRSWSPGLAVTGFDERNWSFVAIAVYVQSLKILTFFFQQDPGSVAFMFQRANPGFGSYSPMGLLSLTRNARFVWQVLNLLIPHFNELRTITQETDFEVFSSVVKYQFCKFATPTIAEKFKKLGIVIYDFGNIPRLGNPYHAAASNNIAFLDYLSKNLKMYPNTPNNYGESPLRMATRLRNVEANRWFRYWRLRSAAMDGI